MVGVKRMYKLLYSKIFKRNGILTKVDISLTNDVYVNGVLVGILPVDVVKRVSLFKDYNFRLLSYGLGGRSNSSLYVELLNLSSGKLEKKHLNIVLNASKLDFNFKVSDSSNIRGFLSIRLFSINI